MQGNNHQGARKQAVPCVRMQEQRAISLPLTPAVQLFSLARPHMRAFHVSCACSQPLAPACSWQLGVVRDFLSLCLTPILTWTEPSQLAWFNFFMTFLATFAPAALL